MFIYIGVRKELRARPLKCQGFLKTGTMSGRSEQRILGVGDGVDADGL